MRKNSLVAGAGALLMIALTATTGSAQQGAQQIRLGAYAGMSLARISEGNDVLLDPDAPEVTGSLSRRIGAQFGIWLNKPLTNRLSFQPELHYTQKGVKISSALDDFGEAFDVEADLSINYLEVPLLLAVNLGSAGTSSVRPFLLAGPALAFKTGCSFGVEAGDFSVNAPCDGSEFDGGSSGDLGLKSFDAGAVVGGGVGFPIGGREYTIGVRYTQGLISITRNAESVKNSNFSVLFGIGF